MANTTNFGWETPDDTDLVKDGAAAMRTLGNSIDASFVDLKGGTTGQVLAKASNTDLDFVWSADAAGIPPTIFDAKGDLIAASAADTAARLAVGTNGQVLTADSTTGTGLRWATPTSPAENFALLNSGGTALTGASTITVSGISNANALHIRIEGASSTSASAIFEIRFNSDTSSVYSYAALVLDDLQVIGDSLNSGTSFPFGRMGNASANTVSGHLTVLGTNAAGVKPTNWAVRGIGSGTAQTQVGNGQYRGTSTISSVSIISSSGNFDAGTIWVYGG